MSARWGELRIGAAQPFSLSQLGEVRKRESFIGGAIERLLAGLGYLQEASLVAQSAEVKRRVYREMIARYGAEERLDQASELLERARNVLTGPDASATLAAWQARLEELGQEATLRRQQQEKLAQQAYLERLRERYHKAVASEDESGAARYRSLLSEAGLDVE